MRQKEIGECKCLDVRIKENISNVLSDKISSYGVQIARTTTEARRFREKGDIATAELADHTVDSFRFLQNDLSETLQIIRAIEDCK